MDRFARRVALVLVVAATSLVPLGALTNPASAASACGVSPGPTWRIVATTTPCSVIAKIGSNVPLSLSTHDRWTAPTRSSSAVSLRVTRPSTGGLHGVIHAARTGTATISSVGTVACPSGTPCPDLAILWRLRVTVVASLAHHLTVTVTSASQGAAYALRVGDHLVVNLSGPSNYTWTTPNSPDATVLERLSGSPGVATFLAVGSGSTSVTAVDSPNCYPQCLPPSQLFQVHVTVS